MRFTRSQCYSILNLEVNSSQDAVRNAYRQLVKQYHPDVNPSPDASIKFRRIQQAYEQILDSNFRSEPLSNAPFDSVLQEEQEEKERLQKEKRKRMRKEYLRRKAEKEKIEGERRNREFKWFGLGLIVFTLLNLGSFKGKQMYTRWSVLQDPDTTYCQVTYMSYRNCNYRYLANGEYLSGEVRTRKVGHQMVGGNGMPLREGYQFGVVYKKSDPSMHFIEYSKVGSNTFQAYLNISKEAAQRFFMKEDSTFAVNADCFVKRLYREEGIDGWANLYFGKTSWLDNIRNNRDEFEEWLESEEGASSLEHCSTP